MQAIMTPITPLEAGGEMFQRGKTPSMFEARTSTARPLSEATEFLDTDFEDGSEFEGEDDYSPKGSFESVGADRAPHVAHVTLTNVQEDSRRRSQTTISSYDEAQTPSSNRGSQQPFEIRFRPAVEGPRGPHLFRSSQASSELSYDYALQMSPLLPKQPPPRTETAFSEETVTPIVQTRDEDFSIAAALAQPLIDNHNPESWFRCWSTQQVIDWMYSAGVDASVIECFEVHDVNGNVLLDLEFEDLKELDIQSFGKRHQLWSAICDLRGEHPAFSPQPTPFEDISRPCTRNTRRSPSRNRDACETPIGDDADLVSPATGKKRRGRKLPKHLDVITPAESVSIVAIEQLLPKPHKCAKGERCAKWRKQQRELKQLHEENGLGRFPISPTKGGRIFVHGDPGNAQTALNIVPNVRKPAEDPFRPQSDAIPSIVASSDLLGPGQLPEFALHPDILGQLDKRDPQDNVRQFLNFQHMQSPLAPEDDRSMSPPPELIRSNSDPIVRSESVPLFPEHHHQAYPSLQPPRHMMPTPHGGLKQLPKLDIPRSATAGPCINSAIPASAASICRSITASPTQIYRLGTPASEVDVPMTAFPVGPIERDTSHSVPPNMQFRQPARSLSRATDRRRPSAALPALKENEVLPPSNPSSRSGSGSSSSDKKAAIRDPAHHSPNTQRFGYGAECTHAGWMKKRKNKMLRHEWNDAHFRLKGTELGMYANARYSAAAMETINVDDYAVACSTAASSSKLTAAMKAFNIRSESSQKKDDPTAFAFQLVPQPKEGEKRHVVMNSKTHHFAVKDKDERIDWMRELMLAKALQQKGKGYDVEVNGVQA